MKTKVDGYAHVVCILFLIASTIAFIIGAFEFGIMFGVLSVGWGYQRYLDTKTHTANERIRD